MGQPVNRLPTLLQSMDEAARSWFLSLAQKRTVAKGEALFHQGDPAIAMYLVESGLVKVFRVTSDGKEHIFHFISAGETFAEAALFEDRTYPASATALEAGTVFTFSRQALLSGIARHPDMALALFTSMSRLVRELVRQFHLVSSEPAESRFGRFLLEELQRQPPGVIVVPLSMRKLDLAAYLGISPETLSRTMKRFANEGLIEVQGSDIKVLDSRALLLRFD